MDDPRSQRSFEAKRQQIMADHRRLGDLLTQLQQAPHPSDVAPLLTDLRGLLRRHFAREQAPDGLFDMIESRAPRHGKTVQRLLRQHESFLEELEQLNRGARDDDPALDGVIGFVTRLREHESTESRLLMEALSEPRRGGS